MASTNKVPYTDGAGKWGLLSLTLAARRFLASPDVESMREVLEFSEDGGVLDGGAP